MSAAFGKPVAYCVVGAIAEALGTPVGSKRSDDRPIDGDGQSPLVLFP